MKIAISPDQIKAPASAMQGAPIASDVEPIVSQSTMGIKVIGLMQSCCSLLMIVGIIVGIIYMIKSKKTKGIRILIGAIIIVVPFILNWILGIVKLNMILNV